MQVPHLPFLQVNRFPRVPPGSPEPFCLWRPSKSVERWNQHKR